MDNTTCGNGSTLRNLVLDKKLSRAELQENGIEEEETLILGVEETKETKTTGKWFLIHRLENKNAVEEWIDSELPELYSQSVLSRPTYQIFTEADTRNKNYQHMRTN